MSKRKMPMALDHVQVGDAIWSGDMRWIVTERLKTRFRAERRGTWSAISETWSYSGEPLSALRPAEPETPERRDAWQRQQAEIEARRREVAEARAARIEARAAMEDFMLHLATPHPEGTRLAKAQALAAFVTKLIEGGE